MAITPSAMAAQCHPFSAESLNRGCSCRSLDAERLREELEAEPWLAGLAETIAQTRPHLFAALAVFISPAQLERMAAIIAAVEQVIALPAYREAAIARAPASAGCDFGPRGVFTGYDFHMTTNGPRLIEVNTNAGGALLNAALLHAQKACCSEMVGAALAPIAQTVPLEQLYLDMFIEEWRLQRGGGSPCRIAIVDDEPAAQYLYPEFLLFQRLFARHGIPAVVADATRLEWRDGALSHGGERVDMVYNRLTDFHFDQPGHAALRAAYQSGSVVVTPGPYTYALYADKRNLVTLSDDTALTALGVPADMRRVLVAGIPHTEQVSAQAADPLWQRRRRLFFKPVSGYGGRAAYRGDKLTRRVWQEILGGQYVAQEIIPPSERRVEVDGIEADLKLDIRAYAYAGRLQLIAARLYQGQTTNFRTAGGGFAPVYVVPNAA